jgi:hypothetical protein
MTNRIRNLRKRYIIFLLLYLILLLLYYNNVAGMKDIIDATIRQAGPI